MSNDTPCIPDLNQSCDAASCPMQPFCHSAVYSTSTMSQQWSSGHKPHPQKTFLKNGSCSLKGKCQSHLYLVSISEIKIFVLNWTTRKMEMACFFFLKWFSRAGEMPGFSPCTKLCFHASANSGLKQGRKLSPEHDCGKKHIDHSEEYGQTFSFSCIITFLRKMLKLFWSYCCKESIQLWKTSSIKFSVSNKQKD